MLSGKLPSEEGLQTREATLTRTWGWLAAVFAAAMAANAADWADDHEQPTPAQRAAAIADKAVDEITNQGYHYWCAHS